MVYSFQGFKLWHLLVYTQPFLCLLYAADAACFWVSKWKTLSLFLKHNQKEKFPWLCCSWAHLCTVGWLLDKMLSSSGYCLNKVQTVPWRTVSYYSQLAHTSSLSSLFLVRVTSFYWEIRKHYCFFSVPFYLAAETRMWSKVAHLFLFPLCLLFWLLRRGKEQRLPNYLFLIAIIQNLLDFLLFSQYQTSVHVPWSLWSGLYLAQTSPALRQGKAASASYAAWETGPLMSLNFPLWM